MRNESPNVGKAIEILSYSISFSQAGDGGPSFSGEFGLAGDRTIEFINLQGPGLAIATAQQQSTGIKGVAPDGTEFTIQNVDLEDPKGQPLYDIEALLRVGGKEVVVAEGDVTVIGVLSFSESLAAGDIF